MNGFRRGHKRFLRLERSAESSVIHWVLLECWSRVRYKGLLRHRSRLGALREDLTKKRGKASCSEAFRIGLTADDRGVAKPMRGRGGISRTEHRELLLCSIEKKRKGSSSVRNSKDGGGSLRARLNESSRGRLSWEKKQSRVNV